jgi:hypothetical protein
LAHLNQAKSSWSCVNANFDRTSPHNETYLTLLQNYFYGGQHLPAAAAAAGGKKTFYIILSFFHLPACTSPLGQE